MTIALDVRLALAGAAPAPQLLPGYGPGSVRLAIINNDWDGEVPARRWGGYPSRGLWPGSPYPWLLNQIDMGQPAFQAANPTSGKVMWTENQAWLDYQAWLNGGDDTSQYRWLVSDEPNHMIYFNGKHGSIVGGGNFILLDTSRHTNGWYPTAGARAPDYDLTWHSDSALVHVATNICKGRDDIGQVFYACRTPTGNVYSVWNPPMDTWLPHWLVTLLPALPVTVTWGGLEYEIWSYSPQGYNLYGYTQDGLRIPLRDGLGAMTYKQYALPDGSQAYLRHKPHIHPTSWVLPIQGVPHW